MGILTEDSYKQATAKQDITAMAYSLGCFTIYYTKTNHHKQAIHYGKQALQLAEQAGHQRLMNDVEDDLMQVYFVINDYKTALYHADRILERAAENDWSALKRVYLQAALIYAAMGNTDKASVFANKYQEVMGKISDENMQSALEEMQVKYDVQQKEWEMERQQTTIQKQRTKFVITLIIFGFLVSMLIIIVAQRTRRNRILTETNAIKDRFLSIISHDLKNPAISQRDAIQALLDNTGEWNVEALREYYMRLLTSADSQVDLLFNILNWAYVQTRRMPYFPRLFNLAASLRTDLSVLKNMANMKNIRLNISLPEQVLVTGDSDMLNTVVRNLITNAVKFTHSGGEVSLTIAPEETDSETTKYTVSIADTGVGMSSERLQILLHTHSMPSRKETSGKQRIGLGMVICREFLTKHGSHLQAESEEGKGSRFWFTV